MIVTTLRPSTTLTQFLLRGFLRLVALTAPLFVVFAVISAFGDRRVSWLDTTTSNIGPGPAALGTPRPGTTVELEGHVRYAVEHASIWLWGVSLLPGLLLGIAVSTVALLLLRMMADTYAGRPFVGQGATRLRRVAAVIGVGAFVVPVLQAVSAHAIASRVVPAAAPGVIARWDVLGATVPWLVVALLVLVVAEAFDIGARLAHDVAGLV
jgi:hypothetical protein